MKEHVKIRLVLVGIEGEINLGFMLRLAKNFEVDEVYLVAPQANVKSDVVRRFAAHAEDLVNKVVVVEELEDALKDIALSACTSARPGQKTDVLRRPLTPWEFAELASNYSSVAIVFGRESVGLTRDEIAKCDLLVTIPANPEYPVMNISHAAAVILYELYKRVRKGHVHVEPPRDVHLRVLIQRAECIARFVLEDEPARVVHAIAALKHVITRSNPSAGEVSILNYLFKRLAVKLGAETCLR